MSGRKKIADALKQKLSGTIDIVEDLRELGELDPSLTGVIQLFRTKVEPGGQVSAYWQDFELWVIDPNYDPALVEDALDDHLDNVINVLDKLTWLNWTSAERDTHPSGYHGYRISIRTTGDPN